MTLDLLNRFIPAMPMAESKPPIVVGMRHTRSATRTVMVIGLPCPDAFTLKTEKGKSVTTTSRKMSDSAARRIPRAISFGVFCLFAPSTMAIMRSKKLWPGRAVTRTMSQSEMTRVPPVTELRSPPLSRTTGALSPVMALSSTEATPSTTSPSAGTISPARTMTTSSRARSVAETSVVVLAWRSLMRWAVTWVRDFRRLSAWALPCPSAMASAKLAKSTVNQSQIETARMNPAGSPEGVASALNHMSVVRILPRKTTNMTGFLS